MDIIDRTAKRPVGFMRPIIVVLSFLVLMTGCATSVQHSGPVHGVQAERISVSGFGSGYTGRMLRTMIKRSVSLAIAAHVAEGHPPRISSHAFWVFDLQTNISNRPETIITARFVNGETAETSGFLKTAALGTGPPIVFVDEIARFAHQLIDESGGQKL